MQEITFIIEDHHESCYNMSIQAICQKAKRS